MSCIVSARCWRPLCDSRGGGTAINASPSGQLPGWPVRLQRSACAARAACHHQRGHYAVEQAIRARPFEVLRRRRNELEYPYLPADTAHVGRSRASSRDSPATNRRCGQVACTTVLLQPRPGVTGPSQEPQMESCVPAFAEPPAIVSFLAGSRLQQRQDANRPRSRNPESQ